MTSQNTLRERMQASELLVGTFVKTPAYELIEVLARSGLDFICLDAEHAPFDRARLDACLAVARALSFETLVRVESGTAQALLQALDSGATGVVVPHVDTAEKAADIARWSRFGHGGRGYAGSTRWAGFATRGMPELLQQSRDETVVIAQIEEPEGVDAIEGIAAVDGIDGLFVGPADLAVCLGTTDIYAPVVLDAMRTVSDAARRHGKMCMTFAGNPEQTEALKALGLNMFFMASEHAFMLNAAKACVNAVKQP